MEIPLVELETPVLEEVKIAQLWEKPLEVLKCQGRIVADSPPCPHLPQYLYS